MSQDERDPLEDPQPGDVVEWANGQGRPPTVVVVVGRREPSDPPSAARRGCGSVVEVVLRRGVAGDGDAAFMTHEWRTMAIGARVLRRAR